MPPCPAPIIQMLPAAHDSEWLKTLVSLALGVILGVISAFVLEPAKVKRLRRIEAELGEDIIYDEIGMVLNGLRAAVNATLPKSAHDLHIKRFKLEKYDYYYGQRREVFYAMKDNLGLWRLRSQVALMVSDEQVAKYGAKNATEEIIKIIEYLVLVKDIDGERIKAAEDKYRRTAEGQIDQFTEFMYRPK